MKFLLLGLFVALATAVPLPEEDIGDPVEVIVNGLPEGEPLEIGDIVDIKLNQHVDGDLQSTSNVLHPFSAVGLAEAAAAAEAAAEAANPVLPSPDIPGSVVLPEPAQPEVVIPDIPDSIVLPEPAQPEVVVPDIPDSIVLPEPAQPEVVVPDIPDSIVLPEPGQPEVVVPDIPDSVVLPGPAQPEVVVPETPVEPLPVPAPQFPNGEIYNDGVVQVQVNAPEDLGVLQTLQSWMSMVLNYISSGVQTTQQII